MASLEKSFYPGHSKRRIRVEKYEQLETVANEARKKIVFSMQIDGESFLGVPEWVGDAYVVLAKGAAHASRVNIDVKLNGMTLEFYATDQSATRALLLTKCKLKSFHVVREGLEEAAKYFLMYTAYVPDSQALHDWLREMFRQDCFVKFDVDQEDLAFDGKAAAAGDDAAEMADEAFGPVGDDYDAERRESLSADHDDEYDDKAARTTSLVSVGGGRKKSRIQFN
jgi:hypothetical protein